MMVVLVSVVNTMHRDNISAFSQSYPHHHHSIKLSYNMDWINLLLTSQKIICDH
ncbi:unnamed protein product [Schistosoma mattheei]|uniref:Uncharacterized protein n=1 Tax=Schistosoma mattheei TaxID=31246 RepID=A0A183PMM4_9TREM|nr:unnamed protein product [Schistosoma mattheei]